MPIPEANSPWMPKPWDTAYAAYAENEAWWLGDVEKLQAMYGGDQQATHMHAGVPHRGGVMGALYRGFWGRPVVANENRTRLHVPAPADLATLASDLVFAEPPEVRLSQANEKARARLDLIANSDMAHVTFNQMGEMKSALGATILVSRWNTAVEDHVWLEASGADVIIPTFISGRMTEVTLWTEYVENSTYFRHLEHHAPGYIEHALFEGTAKNLGRRVPLDAHPETRQYAGIVNSASVIETGIERLTATYNPNVPTIAWRKKGSLSATGRSDFAQLHQLFDAIDETFSSWIRDLRQGAGRLIVPEAALNLGARGQGASFDMNRELFAGLNIPGNPDRPLDQVQFAIRVEEHERTMSGIYKEILRKSGLSSSSWGDYDGQQGAMTATEVTDRKSASERTRDKKLLHDRGAIARQSSVALELDGKVFPGKGGGLFDAPTVTFVDVSQEDPLVLAQTLSLLEAAGAISTEQKVRRFNPDWDDEQVNQEVAKIREDRGTVMDPTTFDGGPVADPAEPDPEV